jgi:hypothetical protein
VIQVLAINIIAISSTLIIQSLTNLYNKLHENIISDVLSKQTSFNDTFKTTW